MLRLRSPEPRLRTVAAARFTTIPTSATISTKPPRTSGGEASRAIASYTITAPSTNSVTPLACAERISTRPSPYVIAPFGGLVASRAAASEIASAAASVSMCAASDSSASDDASTPTATSATMNARISASAVFSAPWSASRPW